MFTNSHTLYGQALVQCGHAQSKISKGRNGPKQGEIWHAINIERIIYSILNII